MAGLNQICIWNEMRILQFYSERKYIKILSAFDRLTKNVSRKLNFRFQYLGYYFLFWLHFLVLSINMNKFRRSNFEWTSSEGLSYACTIVDLKWHKMVIGKRNQQLKCKQIIWNRYKSCGFESCSIQFIFYYKDKTNYIFQLFVRVR